MEKTFLKSFIRIVAIFNNSPSVTVYNFLLQGPVTLTPVTERLAVELLLPIFTIYVCRCWDSNLTLRRPGVRKLIVLPVENTEFILYVYTINNTGSICDHARFRRKPRVREVHRGHVLLR